MEVEDKILKSLKMKTYDDFHIPITWLSTVTVRFWLKYKTTWFGSTSGVVNISNSYQMEEDKYNVGGWADAGTNVLWVVGINKRIFPVIYLQTHHWTPVSPPRLSDS